VGFTSVAGFDPALLNPRIRWRALELPFNLSPVAVVDWPGQLLVFDINWRGAAIDAKRSCGPYIHRVFDE